MSGLCYSDGQKEIEPFGPVERNPVLVNRREGCIPSKGVLPFLFLRRNELSVTGKPDSVSVRSKPCRMKNYRPGAGASVPRTGAPDIRVLRCSVFHPAAVTAKTTLHQLVILVTDNTISCYYSRGLLLCNTPFPSFNDGLAQKLHKIKGDNISIPLTRLQIL